MRVLLGMPLPMPCTKILTNKVAVTAIEVAVIYLLRGILSNISNYPTQAACSEYTDDSIDVCRGAQLESSSCRNPLQGIRISCR